MSTATRRETIKRRKGLTSNEQLALSRALRLNFDLLGGSNDFRGVTPQVMVRQELADRTVAGGNRPLELEIGAIRINLAQKTSG